MRGRLPVLQQRRRCIGVADDEVEIAVVVEIAHGKAAAHRRDLQARLTARGYDVGEPDGKVGQKTRDAIKDVERRLGMTPTGRAGGKVLEALRGG